VRHRSAKREALIGVASTKEANETRTPAFRCSHRGCRRLLQKPPDELALTRIGINNAIAAMPSDAGDSRGTRSMLLKRRSRLTAAQPPACQIRSPAGMIARFVIACRYFCRSRVRTEDCQQDVVTEARRTDRLQHASLTCFAFGLAQGATRAQSKPVNRFQRPSIWSVENSESIVKFAARRR
jgi:hypothetical protein